MGLLTLTASAEHSWDSIEITIYQNGYGPFTRMVMTELSKWDEDELEKAMLKVAFEFLKEGMDFTCSISKVVSDRVEIDHNVL
jgi:translation elongation factor P/translation initiation factor 5A